MPILYDRLNELQTVDVPPMPSNDVELMEYLNYLNQVSFEGLITITSAKFNRRYSTKAGQASNTGAIQMNAHIGCKYEFLSTAIHELTHLFEYQSYGNSSHGKRFLRINQQALNLFGVGEVIKASARHSHKELVKKRSPKKKNRWVCKTEGCCKSEGIHFSAQRKFHARILSGTLEMNCPSCRNPLHHLIVY